jgi:hypothetical protein
MNTNEFPPFANGEFGLAPYHSTGSWPEIDLSVLPTNMPSDNCSGTPTWESDWIDLGGEG